MILCLYVDDILILGSSLDIIKNVKHLLSNNFDIKNLGLEDLILHIKLI